MGCSGHRYAQDQTRTPPINSKARSRTKIQQKQVLFLPSLNAYEGSQEKPTVGRLTDLPWVASATYRRFFFSPFCGGLAKRAVERAGIKGCSPFKKGRSEWGSGSALRSAHRGEDLGQTKGGGDSTIIYGVIGQSWRLYL